jgi:L-threonylcarbamoyladenylate synthase
VIDEVVAAIHAGRPAIVPTDTVYGLAADAANRGAVERLYALKGREGRKPTALVVVDVDGLRAAVPELDERVARALLPGPYTLVLPNPAGRFPWLAGGRQDTIGVRVPAVSGDAAELLRKAGPIAATSANRPGERDPRAVDEIPEELREACAVLDVGPLPGTPSTVVDLTGPEPLVLREGAVPADEALERLSEVRG